MAFGDNYATSLDLEARLNKSDDGTFGDLLNVASRAVEDFTDRQFNKGTTATARRFRAADPERLPVDDFYQTTDLAIDVDGTAWAVADVDPRPWDGFYKGMRGWPFFDLLAVDRTWPASRRALITITAHWGWSAVPEAIKQATLDVAAAMSSNGGISGIVRSESIDGYAVSYSVAGQSSDMPHEFTKALPYRRKRFGIA